MRAEGKPDMFIVTALRERGFYSAVALQDKGAQARRYQRLIKARMDVLRLSSVFKDYDARTLRKLAVDDVKPYLAQYKKVRMQIVRVWQNKKLTQKEKEVQSRALRAERARLQEVLAKLGGQAYFRRPALDERVIGES